VSCVLTPPDPAKFLRELTSLRRILSAGVPVTPEEQLQPGQRARIIRRCFEGLEGTVLINRSGLRLMIAVGLLGRGASIEVTPDMVERL
jgi:transcription antitermination factor NusG